MATFNSTINGSNTGDTLIGTQANQLINAGSGNDSISTSFSLSCLLGNAGNDCIVTALTTVAADIEAALADPNTGVVAFS